MVSSSAAGTLGDAVARPLDYARVAARSGTNYTTNLVWLLRRSVDGRRLRLATMFVLGQLSLGGQAGAIGTLYWYATQMQADAVLSLGPFGDALRVREEPLLLWAVVAVSAVCFAASAWFQFRSRNIVYGIAEEEIARGLGQLVGFARRLPDPRAPLASRLLSEGGLNAINEGCKMGGMTISLLYVALPSVVGGTVAVAAMLWIDPLLTALIVVALVLWSPSLYPLALQSLKVATSRGRENQAFKREARVLLESPSDSIPERWESALKVAEVSLGKRRIMNQMTLRVQIGVTLIGSVSAFYLASGLMSGRGEWPIFLAYLAITRVALNGCFTAPQTFAMVSRFYPRTATYVLFMRSASLIESTSLGHVTNGDAMTLGRLPSGAAVSVRSGQRVALATLADRSALQVALLAASETSAGLPLKTVWLDGAPTPSATDKDVPIALLEYDTLAAMSPREAQSLLRALEDSATLIVYRDGTKIGAFEESQLITVIDGALTASVSMDTAESRTVLASFAEARTASEAKAVSATDDSTDDVVEQEM